MQRNFTQSATALLALSFSYTTTLQATPFEDCPTQAFLVQKPSTIPKTFGVDLATGSTSELNSNMGTRASYNGVGFSDHDDYIYGWDHASSTIAQVGKDYQIKAIQVSKDSLSAKAGNFVAGDVALSANIWFGYKRGKGLFKVYLDGEQAYQMQYVVGSAEHAAVNLTDLAFHPTDGFIYAVTNGESSELVRIDPATGEQNLLGQVYQGSKATFGAQFFDVNGMLYVSNNANGYVYKINVDEPQPVEDVFAYGPISSSNDGARCANAPIPVGDNIDFGDAPASYGSRFGDNGARHDISSDLKLGSSADSESDANSGTDKDDGVQFPTGFESGLDTVVSVDVSGLNTQPAYLNAWVDWDRDGTFETDEQAIVDHQVTEQNQINIQVPTWAEEGETWSRFRLSSQSGIGPTGGVSDGEVEDYAVTVTQTGVTINYYPSSSTYTTLAYEDLYPTLGDYDMNDVVMQLRIAEYVKQGQVIRIKLDAKLAALGASYHNGFAVNLPGIRSQDIQQSAISMLLDGVQQTTPVLEANMTEAVILISNDLKQTVTTPTPCHYYRTQNNCVYQAMPQWQIDIPFVNPIAESQMPAFPYDPFIFATPGTYHGDDAVALLGSAPGRRLEIHLKNSPPTSAFDSGFFGFADDKTSQAEQSYFVSDNGMSWALEIPIDWQHPKAGVRLDQAYPQFINFAKDKSGVTNPTWYMHKTANQTFSEQE
ncbi:LruC domain-containing protein [Saccharobesus litoralis]|uniref:LruC domain-containing protein n=1 Tax=Saccharobesus litoralis TaxID=2172099 RepID=A0A2S0VMF5_9ALTE|nr:LruC domain-containing protein [Saccharobesus litoralis]AWB65359.1 LruC domain-containing protein [Saccharobesus litoralis]